jgi:APA family basic amino acid/polyamine antiporter
MITGAVVALASGFTSISVLGSLVSIGTLFAFVIVAICVIALRRSQPDLPRPFRTPWVPAVPVLAAAVSLFLMASLPRATWERLIIWMAIGVVVYFAYGRRKSKLA